MDRSEKIEKRVVLEKILALSSAIENRDKLLKSLKGYSRYTKEVEKLIYDDPFKSMYTIIGKLVINDEVFQETAKQKGNKKLSFFSNPKNYIIVSTEDEFNEFKTNFFENDKNENKEVSCEEKEKFINCFFEKNSKIKKTEENIEKISNFFVVSKQEDLLEKALKYKDLVENFTKVGFKKGDLEKGLGLNSKEANLLGHREKLSQEFSGENEVIKKLRVVRNSVISKTKDLDDPEKIKTVILSGKVKNNDL